MKLFGFVSTAALFLILVYSAPGYALQNQQDEAKPAPQEEPKPEKQPGLKKPSQPNNRRQNLRSVENRTRLAMGRSSRPGTRTTMISRPKSQQNTLTAHRQLRAIVVAAFQRTSSVNILDADTLSSSTVQ